MAHCLQNGIWDLKASVRDKEIFVMNYTHAPPKKSKMQDLLCQQLQREFLAKKHRDGYDAFQSLLQCQFISQDDVIKIFSQMVWLHKILMK